MSSHHSDRTQITFQDVADCFSEKEWKLLHEWQKELYKNVMKEIQQTLIALGPLIATSVFSLRAREKDQCFLEPEDRRRMHSSHRAPGDSALTHVVSISIKEEGDHYSMDRQGTQRREDTSITTGTDHRSKYKKMHNEDTETCEVFETQSATNDEFLLEWDEPEEISNQTPKTTQGQNVADWSIESGRVVDKPERFVKLARPNMINEEYICAESENNFNKHLSYSKHSQIYKEDNSPICSREGEMFTTSPTKTTYQQIHTGDRPYPAPECENSVSMPSVHARQQIVPENKQYPYTDHGNSFSQSAQLITHQTKQISDSSYSYSDCGKSFDNLPVLHTQHQTQAEAKIYPCNVCGKNFSLISSLHKHKRTHTDDKPYTCMECGKTFRCSSSLHSHKRVHTKDKPYPCPECGKRFSQSTNLKTHQRIHTGEKPYFCTACGKSFNNLSILHTHQRIHTGEKPYQCNECGKHFRHLSSLQKHSRTHITVL